MTFWSSQYFAIGFFATNFWIPAGEATVQAKSFTLPQTALYTVVAGQTTGGPSGSGQPFSAQSNTSA